MRAPDYAKGRNINGYWEGEEYLFLRPIPVYNLTWTRLWRLFKLRLSSPRADKFKIAIADYGYDD